MQEIHLKIRHFERGLLKTLEFFPKIFFLKFFLSNPVPFNEQSYQKPKGPRTSDQSLLWLQIKFTKSFLLVMYYLTKFDGVI